MWCPKTKEILIQIFVDLIRDGFHNAIQLKKNITCIEQMNDKIENLLVMGFVLRRNVYRLITVSMI